MIETRSALAELAERITEVLASYQDDMYLEHRQTLDMAQRIVAELAKVEDVNDVYRLKLVKRPNQCQAIDAIVKCREIAEEGAEDEGR